MCRPILHRIIPGSFLTNNQFQQPYKVWFKLCIKNNLFKLILNRLIFSRRISVEARTPDFAGICPVALEIKRVWKDLRLERYMTSPWPNHFMHLIKICIFFWPSYVCREMYAWDVIYNLNVYRSNTDTKWSVEHIGQFTCNKPSFYLIWMIRHTLLAYESCNTYRSTWVLFRMSK